MGVDVFGNPRCKCCEGTLEETDLQINDGFCKYCRPAPKDKEAKPKTKQQKLAEKYPDDRIYVEMKCNDCGHVSKIRVHKSSLPIYQSEDYKKKYICLVCDSKKKQGLKKRSGWDLGKL